MDIHKNARLTPHSRAELVRRVLEQGQTPKAVATAYGVCVKTVRKWVDRFRIEGPKGLSDRSSRPHRLRKPTPPGVVEQIELLRRQRYTGKQMCQTAPTNLTRAGFPSGAFAFDRCAAGTPPPHKKVVIFSQRAAQAIARSWLALSQGVSEADIKIIITG